MTDLTEAVALAILNWTREQNGWGPLSSLDEMREDHQPEWRASATAALAAIEAAGPTPAMIAAGEDALGGFIQRRDAQSDIVSAVFRAMIAAARETKI